MLRRHGARSAFWTFPALAAALGLSCGSDREAAEDAGRGAEFYAAAMKSLEAAPELVSREVLRTCDKWHHLDGPCDENRVRREQLECWSDKGEAILRWTEKRGMRPRASTLRTLLEVNVCMEMRRWRRNQPGPEL